MADRTSNAALSKENEAFIAAGYYTSPTGARVDLRGFVTAATRGVANYTPDDVTRLLGQQVPTPPTAATFTTKFEITPETSTAAAARLHAEGRHPTVLNYASATKPGGGYLSGARAQEEDLCRSSALYTSLMCAPDFYTWHKKNKDGRYSHRMIWTPNVVVYRDATSHALLPVPYLTSFITAAAPNAGAIAKNLPAALPHVPTILRERAARILAVAAAHNATNLVLGAWGCGVFRNSPAEVAAIFRGLLIGGPFDGRFDKVVFAVYDTSPAGSTLKAFEDAFPVGPGTVHLDPTGIRAAAVARGQDAERRREHGGERRDARDDRNGGRSGYGGSGGNGGSRGGHGGHRGDGGHGGRGDTGHSGQRFAGEGRRLGSGRDASPSRNSGHNNSSSSRAETSSASRSTPKPATKGPLDAWLVRKPAPVDRRQDFAD